MISVSETSVNKKVFQIKKLLDSSVKANAFINKEFDAVIVKLGNLSPIQYVTEKVEGAFSFLVQSNEYFVPLGHHIDVEAEVEKLQKEIAYTQGFLKSAGRKKS